MNRREKILAGSIGGIVGLFVVIWGIRALISQPLHVLDQRIATAREKISKIQGERRTFFAAEDRLKSVTQRTFADTIDQASAQSGELLTRQIIQAGLAEADFTRLPVGPRKIRGASEIGWNVQGDGALSNVVNLLFTLNQSPWLHRTENLAVTRGDSPGVVRVRFRYLTLVIDPAPDVVRTNLVAGLGLESPERHLLNSIVSRDVLRPYIRRPPPPPVPPATAPSSAPGSRPAAPPGPESFRIVSLSEWEGVPEVHIRDLTAQKTHVYHPGDALEGGTVVMIDYRTLPRTDNSQLKSSSRMILKIGAEYFAIERGRTLADKRKLAPSDLPPALVRPL